MSMSSCSFKVGAATGLGGFALGRPKAVKSPAAETGRQLVYRVGLGNAHLRSQVKLQGVKLNNAPVKVELPTVDDSQRSWWTAATSVASRTFKVAIMVPLFMAVVWGDKQAIAGRARKQAAQAQVAQVHVVESPSPLSQLQSAFQGMWGQLQHSANRAADHTGELLIDAGTAIRRTAGGVTHHTSSKWESLTERLKEPETRKVLAVAAAAVVVLLIFVNTSGSSKQSTSEAAAAVPPQVDPPATTPPAPSAAMLAATKPSTVTVKASAATTTANAKLDTEQVLAEFKSAAAEITKATAAAAREVSATNTAATKVAEQAAAVATAAATVAAEAAAKAKAAQAKTAQANSSPPAAASWFRPTSTTTAAKPASTPTPSKAAAAAAASAKHQAQPASSFVPASSTAAAVPKPPELLKPVSTSRGDVMYKFEGTESSAKDAAAAFIPKVSPPPPAKPKSTSSTVNTANTVKPRTRSAGGNAPTGTAATPIVAALGVGAVLWDAFAPMGKVIAKGIADSAKASMKAANEAPSSSTTPTTASGSQTVTASVEPGQGRVMTAGNDNTDR
eukprot:jgi/Chrzof1/11110/Cz05g24050.t1